MPKGENGKILKIGIILDPALIAFKFTFQENFVVSQKGGQEDQILPQMQQYFVRTSHMFLRHFSYLEGTRFILNGSLFAIVGTEVGCLVIGGKTFKKKVNKINKCDIKTCKQNAKCDLTFQFCAYT